MLWTKNGKIIEEVDGVHFENKTLEYSFLKIISWKNITKNDRGTYQCEANRCMNKSETVSIEIYEAKSPKIKPSFHQTTMLHKMGDILTVNCTVVTGLPRPTLIWYKNDKVFEIKNSTGRDIEMSSDNSSITFRYLNVEDSGKYICRADNRIDEDEKKFELIVEGNY